MDTNFHQKTSYGMQFWMLPVSFITPAQIDGYYINRYIFTYSNANCIPLTLNFCLLWVACSYIIKPKKYRWLSCLPHIFYTSY